MLKCKNVKCFEKNEKTKYFFQGVHHIDITLK